MKNAKELHLKCLRQLERIEYLQKRILDYQKRIEIELAKDSIMRFDKYAEQWLNYQIVGCQCKITIRQMNYREAMGELTKIEMSGLIK